MSENGPSFTVSLATQPTDTVTVSVWSLDTGAATVSRAFDELQNNYSRSRQTGGNGPLTYAQDVVADRRLRASVGVRRYLHGGR